MELGDLDTRWKNPQSGSVQNLYLWAQELIKELRKGDYLDGDLASSRIIGTIAQDNAAAGYVGEYLDHQIASASAVSLTTATVANVAHIDLTPGDWDVRATAYFSATATTSINRVAASLSSSPTSLFVDPGRWYNRRQAPSAAGTSSTAMLTAPIPPWRMNLIAPETCYLTVLCDFTVDTLSAWGMIAARRMR